MYEYMSHCMSLKVSIKTFGKNLCTYMYSSNIPVHVINIFLED